MPLNKETKPNQTSHPTIHLSHCLPLPHLFPKTDPGNTCIYVKMLITIYANICIHTPTNTCTNTHIFKTTQTLAHIYARKIPLQAKNQKTLRTVLISLFLKSFHLDEYVKHETKCHGHYHVILLYIWSKIKNEIRLYVKKWKTALEIRLTAFFIGITSSRRI